MSNDPAAYREQIARCTDALARGQLNRLRRELVGDARLDQVAAFSQENAEKRAEKLLDRLEWMRDHFPDLEAWVNDYVAQVPAIAYANTSRDIGRFFDWIVKTHRPSQEQRECFAMEGGRLGLEEIARHRRALHVQFQRRLRESDPDLLAADRNPELHLNPIHSFATLRTMLFLDEEASPPAEIVQFAMGGEIRMAILEPQARRILTVLDTLGPMPIRKLAERLPQIDRDELTELCREMAEMGLLAVRSI